jgi:hypothetical protein
VVGLKTQVVLPVETGAAPSLEPSVMVDMEASAVAVAVADIMVVADLATAEAVVDLAFPILHFVQMFLILKDHAKVMVRLALPTPHPSV